MQAPQGDLNVIVVHQDPEAVNARGTGVGLAPNVFIDKIIESVSVGNVETDSDSISDKLTEQTRCDSLYCMFMRKIHGSKDDGVSKFGFS